MTTSDHTPALTRMLQTHPRAAQVADLPTLAECIAACAECIQICAACADACLAEADPAMMVPCIRLDLDCADICGVTGRVLVRQTATTPEVVRAQLQACLVACRACADECSKHAGHHEHCGVCAETCRRCEAACQALLDTLAA
jgi:hypothetical protein